MKHEVLCTEDVFDAFETFYDALNTDHARNLDFAAKDFLDNLDVLVISTRRRKQELEEARRKRMQCAARKRAELDPNAVSL